MILFALGIGGLVLYETVKHIMECHEDAKPHNVSSKPVKSIPRQARTRTMDIPDNGVVTPEQFKALMRDNPNMEVRLKK